MGINNLKDRYQSNTGLNGQVNIPAAFDSWLSTLVKLRNLCPYSKIIVSPIMPTKIRSLNARAITFNRLIFSCVNKFWSELDFHSFVNDSGLLDDNFGRLYGEAKVHKKNIPLGPLLSMPGSAYHKVTKKVAEWSLNAIVTYQPRV